jgi:hypothetical protein
MRFAAACLCGLLVLVHLGTRADEHDLSERQLDAILRRAETLLRQGRYLEAIRASDPADRALMSEVVLAYDSWPELNARSRSVGWTSVVRLGGAYTLEGKPAKDKHAVLVAAQARLRELLKHDKPLYKARHAEALVALGDRMPEAYATLHALQEEGAIEEPESYAALAIAAGATDHADVQASAREACMRLAKRRAKQLCPK